MFYHFISVGTVPIDVGGNNDTTVVIHPTVPDSSVSFSVAIRRVQEVDANDSIIILN